MDDTPRLIAATQISGCREHWPRAFRARSLTSCQFRAYLPCQWKAQFNLSFRDKGPGEVLDRLRLIGFV